MSDHVPADYSDIPYKTLLRMYSELTLQDRKTILDNLISIFCGIDAEAIETSIMAGNVTEYKVWMPNPFYGATVVAEVNPGDAEPKIEKPETLKTARLSLRSLLEIWNYYPLPEATSISSEYARLLSESALDEFDIRSKNSKYKNYISIGEIERLMSFILARPIAECGFKISNIIFTPETFTWRVVLHSGETKDIKYDPLIDLETPVTLCLDFVSFNTQISSEIAEFIDILPFVLGFTNEEKNFVSGFWVAAKEKYSRLFSSLKSKESETSYGEALKLSPLFAVISVANPDSKQPFPIYYAGSLDRILSILKALSPRVVKNTGLM